MICALITFCLEFQFVIARIYFVETFKIIHYKQVPQQQKSDPKTSTGDALTITNSEANPEAEDRELIVIGLLSGAAGAVLLGTLTVISVFVYCRFYRK